MGNAVDSLHKKKLEQRKKQSEEERKIFQACLEWSIKQEENRKQEALAKREKAWKERELARMKRDKDLMERYINNIESGKKQKEGDLKEREKMIEERKRLSSSLSQRKIHKREEHLKEESQVMAKNLEIIEKRSEKSREAMKMRIVSLARKKEKDKKEFIHRTTKANQERKREIENSKRRIRYIEKKIAQDRVQWQAKLMAARGLDNNGKRVSSRQLWAIGRKTLEKKRLEYLKSTESYMENTSDVGHAKETSKRRTVIKGMTMKVADVKKTLSTVNEEDSVKLDQPIDVSGNTCTHTRQLNDYSRSYLPQKNLKATKNTTTDFSNGNEFENSSSSTNISLNRCLDNVPPIKRNKVGVGLGRDKVKMDSNRQQDRQKYVSTTSNSILKTGVKSYDRRSMASTIDKNLASDKIGNLTMTLTADKRDAIIQSSSNKSREETIKETTTSTKTQHDAKTVFSRLYNDGPKKQTKQHDIYTANKTKSESTNHGSLVTSQKTLNKKPVVSGKDPLIGQKCNLKQPEVEQILEIKPLAFNVDSGSRSNAISSNTRKTSINTKASIKSKDNQDRTTASKKYIEEIKDLQQTVPDSSVSDSQSVDFKFEFATVQTLKMDKPYKAETTPLTKPTNEHSLNGAKIGTDTVQRYKFFKVSEKFKSPNIHVTKDLTLKKFPGNNTLEQKSHVKSPLKSRSNTYLNSSPEMFILDKRISDVQKRIDNMVKSKADKQTLDSSPRPVPVA